MNGPSFPPIRFSANGSPLPKHPMVPTRPDAHLKFQGYQLHRDYNPENTQAQVDLFLPGYSDGSITKVEAEILRPGDNKPSRIPMAQERDYWVTDPKKPLDIDFRRVIDAQGNYQLFDPLYYRFVLHGKDGVEKTVLDITQNHSLKQLQGYNLFNAVAGHERFAPRKYSNIIDIFQDSAISRKVLEELKAQLAEKPFILRRNTFNQFGGNTEGLMEILNQVAPYGFNAILTKPFIGADRVSAHKYWTVDPFVLNNTFENKDQLKRFMVAAMRKDMKVFADGAFVNQGMNGVQYWTNLIHGHRSPYWDWFTFDYDPSRNYTQKRVHSPFPSITDPNHKMTLGVLPTTINPMTGNEDLDNSRIRIRIQNAPPLDDNAWRQNGLVQALQAPLTWVGLGRWMSQPLQTKHFDPRKPVFVEFMDKNLEKSKPGERHHAHTTSPILRSYDSIQNLQLPVDVKEAREHLKKAQELGARLIQTPEGLDIEFPDHPQSREKLIQLLTEWNMFRLDHLNKDNSSYKWDGKLDVCKMNMENPEVIHYVSQAMAYWTRQVRNTYLEDLGRQLATQTGNGSEKLAHLWTTYLQAPEKRHSSFETPDNALKLYEHLKAMDAYQDVKPEAVPSTLASRWISEYPLSAVPLPNWFKGVLTYPKLNGDPSLAVKLKDTVLPPGMGLDDYPITNWLKTDEPYLLYRVATFPLLPFRHGNIPLLSPLVKKLDNLPFARPKSFEAHLTAKLSEAMGQLPDAQKAALTSPLIQSVVVGEVAEKLYLQLLTGLPPEQQKTATPAQIEAAFLATVPQDIVSGDPVYGAKALKGFLKNQLKNIPSATLTKWMGEQVGNLTPNDVLMAEAVLRVREYGMNWRLDAGKDIGDIDKIRNAGDSEEGGNQPHPDSAASRRKAFREELEKAIKFWDLSNGGLRQIFPQAQILGELTDMWPVSGGDGSAAVRQEMISRSLLNSTSMPNYDVYNRFTRFVADGQEAEGDGPVNAAGIFDEFRGGNISEEDMKNDPLSHIKRAANVRSVPWPSARFFQNMADNHDKAMATHMLLINSHMARLDYHRYLPLTQYAREGMSRLFYKADSQGELLDLAKAMGISGTKDQQLAAVRSKLAYPLQLMGRGMNPAYTQALAEGAAQATQKLKGNWSMDNAKEAAYAALYHVTQKEPSLQLSQGELDNIKGWFEGLIRDKARGEAEKSVANWGSLSNDDQNKAVESLLKKHGATWAADAIQESGTGVISNHLDPNGNVAAMDYIRSIVRPRVQEYLTNGTRQGLYRENGIFKGKDPRMPMSIRKDFIADLFGPKGKGLWGADCVKPEGDVPVWDETLTDRVFNPKAFGAKSYNLRHVLRLLDGTPIDRLPMATGAIETVTFEKQKLQQLIQDVFNDYGLKYVDGASFWQALQAKHPTLDTAHMKRSFTTKAAVMDRMLEPSEATAMRAVVTNITENPETWTVLGQKLGGKLAPSDIQGIRPALQDGIYEALNSTVAYYMRQFGYQALEDALDSVFHAVRLPEGVTQTLQSKGLSEKDFITALKGAMYDTGMVPVAEKMRRLAALQTAVVGSPSVELHSFFLQTGGDTVVPANVFVQNRNVFRTDWVDPNAKADYKPYVKAFQEDVGRLMQLRKDYPALSDGFWLDIDPPAGDSPIVPIGRDNGKQQVIMLINNGNPSPLDWWQNNDVANPINADTLPKPGEKFDPSKHKIMGTYDYPHTTQPVVENYVLDLSALKLPVGTAYQCFDPMDPNAKAITLRITEKDGKRVVIVPKITTTTVLVKTEK